MGKPVLVIKSLSVWVFGVAVLIAATSSIKSNQVKDPRTAPIARARHLDVFYKQMPEFDLFWHYNLKCDSIFTVDGIFSGIYPTQTAKSFGHVWSADGLARIGSFESLYEYRDNETKAGSATTIIRLDRKSVAEIQSDPNQFQVLPHYWGRDLRKELDEYSKKKPVNHLGEVLQTELCAMKAPGLRRTNVAGWEVSLALDAESDLEVTMRSDLPNPYVPAITPYNIELARRFTHERIPTLMKILRGAIFKPGTIISRRLTLDGSILRSDPGGYAHYLAEGPDGHTFMIIILEQPNQNEVELTIRANEWTDISERNRILAASIKSFYIDYVPNKYRPGDNLLSDYRFDSVEHRFLSWDKDIPELLPQ